MKTNKLNLLVFTLFVLLVTSCETSINQPAVTQWELDNQNYVINMKDSAGFVKDTLPTNIGNIYYYYKIIAPGYQNSKGPVSGDSVKVNYRGSLIDGTVFDQTYTGASPVGNVTDAPVTFLINQLFLGWTANLVNMNVSEVRTIVIPQELGYGTSTMGAIPAYSTLRFDIQLISFHH